MKVLKTALVAIALTASVPSVISAQEVREPARAENRDVDRDFGWLGLLGLAGLFGLRGRHREYDDIAERNRATVR